MSPDAVLLGPLLPVAADWPAPEGWPVAKLSGALSELPSLLAGLLAALAEQPEEPAVMPAVMSTLSLLRAVLPLAGGIFSSSHHRWHSVCKPRPPRRARSVAPTSRSVCATQGPLREAEPSRPGEVPQLDLAMDAALLASVARQCVHDRHAKSPLPVAVGQAWAPVLSPVVLGQMWVLALAPVPRPAPPRAFDQQLGRLWPALAN
mmetsp:Transcript_144269/g.264971  ORF Transcript_144269/g.264971 Transcript_144269/m.264971 type:complete len:205 (-) Transcript_144269:255-869(-)